MDPLLGQCWPILDQRRRRRCRAFAESQPGQSIITLKCHMMNVIGSQDWTTPEIITLQDLKTQLLSWLPLSDIPHVSKINPILIFTTLLHKDFSNRYIVHYIHYIVHYILHVTPTRLRYVLKTKLHRPIMLANFIKIILETKKKNCNWLCNNVYIIMCNIVCSM